EIAAGVADFDARNDAAIGGEVVAPVHAADPAAVARCEMVAGVIVEIPQSTAVLGVRLREAPPRSAYCQTSVDPDVSAAPVASRGAYAASRACSKVSRRTRSTSPGATAGLK